MNIRPNYESTALIWLLENYIAANIPPSPTGKPYTFSSFIEVLYDYIVDEITNEKDNNDNNKNIPENN
jgi:hypothetical protein